MRIELGLFFEPKKPSKKEIEEAEKWGGADLDISILPQLPYCDKGGHKERSLWNQPNHNAHWSKEKEEKKR